MTKKTITFELNGYEVERMRIIINTLKDFNRTTDDKADISYELIQQLDGADHFLAKHVGLEQTACEHGHRNWYSDYTWVEDDA